MPRVSQTNPIAELLRQATASNAGAPTITQPSPANYGIYNTSFGKILEGQAADPFNGAAGSSIANQNAQAESAQYERDLANAQRAELQAQETAGYYDLQGKVIGKLPTDAPIGTFEVGAGPGGHYGLKIDPVLAPAYNAVNLDATTAHSFNERATGLAAVAPYGIAPKDAGDTSLFLRSPLENPDNAVQYQYGFKSPEQIRKDYGTDQGLTVGQQYTMQELKNKGQLEAARASAAANDGKWKLVIDPHDNNRETYQFTGTPESIRSQGFNPPTGKGGVPNPNADAQAPGASATQGSVNNFYTHPSSKEGMRTLGGVTRYHHGIDYPKPAGTPYPAEQDGEVVNVGSVPGFGNHVVQVRYADGSEVLYGHGQAANVRPGDRVRAGQTLGLVGSEGHSTGPHVHRQVIRPPTHAIAVPGTNLDKATAMAQRAQERGGTAAVVGNHLVIRAPDGRTKTYDFNGNEVHG